MREASRVGAALLIVLSACGDRSPAGATSSSAPAGASVGAPAPAPSGGLPSKPPAPSSAEVDDELSTQPMELMRFRFTSAIEKREPKDELKFARPGQRVYGYLALRNRTGRRKFVTLAWSVNGEERTKLDLPIDESWQFRTWGFNTLLPTDRKGTLRLEVTDEAGHPIVDETLPIRP